MFKLIFVYLLLIHILGDYYFQTEKLASDKKQSVKKQFKHSAIYLGAGVIGIMPIFALHLFYAVLALSISHFIIDIVKYGYIKFALNDKYTAENQRVIYVIDQILHITCILIAAYILTIINVDISINPIIVRVLIVVGISSRELLSWITIILFIWKPTNITIKQLLCLYKPEVKEESKESNPESLKKPVEVSPCEVEEEEETTVSNAVKRKEEERKEVEESSNKTGGFIGFLERLIILIFLSINQYSAIGLVLTAKSVARYNKITDNQEFAEYYLLGTLLSTVIVIGAYQILI